MPGYVWIWCRCSQNASKLGSSTPSPASLGALLKRRRRVVLEQVKTMPGVTRAPAWGPELSNVAFWLRWAVGFCPGDHCAPPKTILPSVSRSSRVDIRPRQSRTRREIFKHRLTQSSSSNTSCTVQGRRWIMLKESVASPWASIVYAGRGAAAVGTSIKGEYDLEMPR